MVAPTAKLAMSGDSSAIRATPTHSRMEPASRISISPVSLTWRAQPASIRPVRKPSATEPTSCHTSGKPACQIVCHRLCWPQSATISTNAAQIK